MLITLVRKEFRELLPFVALALLAQVYLVCEGTGTHFGMISNYLGGRSTEEAIPFITDSVTGSIILVGSLLAIVGGLWQTMWEKHRGTFLFILHRPISRNAAVGAKLMLGIVVSLTIGVLPMLCYAVWAATPGTHASPFAWAMTGQWWFRCSLLPLLYLGAFLSGLRSGRWFASRFFPLFAAILFVVLAQALWDGSASWRVLIALCSILIEFGYLALILSVARTCEFS
jgi:hypothetical protein